MSQILLLALIVKKIILFALSTLCLSTGISYLIPDSGQFKAFSAGVVIAAFSMSAIARFGMNERDKLIKELDDWVSQGIPDENRKIAKRKI